MERVLGIGGYFLRAADPAALSAWYRECLGLDADENGLWRQDAGPTVFATFDSETDYFGSDRKSTRLNSSHPSISYAVFCLKKKKNILTKHSHNDQYLNSSILHA